MGRHRTRIVIVLFILSIKVYCYEKTLRKIVRNQSKMVHTPFSNDGANMIWKNTSLINHLGANQAYQLPNYAQMRTMLHKIQGPKISTILSTVDKGRGKSSYSGINLGKNENMLPMEFRQAKNIFDNISLPLLSNKDVFFGDNVINSSFQGDVAIEPFYEIPTKSKFFPPSDDQPLASDRKKLILKHKTIIIPENKSPQVNTTVLVKSVFIADQAAKSEQLKNSRTTHTISFSNDVNSDKADYFLEGTPTKSFPIYSFNTSTNAYVCVDVMEINADIDIQDKFSLFDIEPPWMRERNFWNGMFDSRYESLMRNVKWPPLKVILIPRSHVDTIWKRTFDQYHNETVNKIISNIVKKLQFYNKLTFSWNEVSHLSQWWKSTSLKSRSAFRKLVKGGRLEITTGGWVEPDEATTDLFGLVHQLVEGHQWLKSNLNYSPKVGWSTNSVTHSPTMCYILSASGINQLVMTNLHYSWEYYLSEYQYSDFIWLQNWDNDKTLLTTLNKALKKIGKDRYPRHSVLTHYLQFNSASFKACGPNKTVCSTDFNFAKPSKNLDINTYNVKEKSEELLEQYSKAGTLSPHNVIIAPIGGPYRYESQSEFDYQYNNYQKLADFINVNREIYKATVEFGTPKDYFKNILERYGTLPTLKGDFLNFADVSSGDPAYWTGFYTSRPLLKIMLRRLQSTLRSTEILLTYALSYNAFSGFNATDIFDLLLKARESVARLQDRNVVSGTLTASALRYVHHLILTTVKDCWYIQEVSASYLSAKPEVAPSNPYLHKYVYREGEFMSNFKTVSPRDQIYIFNSLSHERTEIVELITKNPNLRILDHNKKDIAVQINPTWKFNSDHFIKISRRYFMISFVVVLPPMTLALYKIKETYDTSQSIATIYCLVCIIDDVGGGAGSPIFPFNIQPIQTGDIQLESYKHRLIFDELTGFLKSVVEKETNYEKTIMLDYGVFRDSNVNSGMFLFNINVSKPLQDILMPYRLGANSNNVMIITGQLTTELTTIYGRLLQHSVKVFNILNSPLSYAIHVQSKVDYEASPKNRELELFLSIQTDIGNGNPPQIFTDNNGFQYTMHGLNISRRIESNVYPITTMAYIQDRRNRLTFITDHSQGVTALQEGQLIVLLDRRVLFDDGRGTHEGLADSSMTCHYHIILLENFIDSSEPVTSHSDLSLPSLFAANLANSLNYQIDLFYIDKGQTNLCFYAFLPLIKTSFPCDIAVINYRVVLSTGFFVDHLLPNTALMILHRQSFSCNINHGVSLRCNSDTHFALDNIIRNMKAAYQTNLVGTNKGVPLLNFNKFCFPPMELTTLRIYY